MLTLPPAHRSITPAGSELSDETQFYVVAKAAAAYNALDRFTPVVRPTSQPDSMPIAASDAKVRALSFIHPSKHGIKATQQYWQTDVITVFACSTEAGAVNHLDFGRQNVLPRFGVDLNYSAYCEALGAVLAQCVFEATKEPDFQCQTSHPASHHPKVIGAPEWLKERRRAVQQMPPPTSEDIQTYFRASAEVRRKLDSKQPS